MPAVLRQSGRKWVKDGVEITPRAMVTFCIGCGFEGAAFGDIHQGKREWWCGWRDGSPACVGKGNGTGQQGGNDGDGNSD